MNTTSTLSSKAPLLAVFSLNVFISAQAIAALTPPLGCAGEFDVGGCPPYGTIFFVTNGNDGSLFEYDSPSFTYSATGPDASIYGAMNMSTGYLAVYAAGIEDGNPSTGTGGIVSVSAIDVFTLHSATPGTINFTAVLTAEGIGTITNNSYSGSVSIQLGLPGGAGDSDGGTFQAGNNAPWGSPFDLYSTVTGGGLMASYDYELMANTPFAFGYSLRADVSQGTIFDLTNSAHLSFILPEGVTITSMSGYNPTIVPLPPAVWLFGSGLIGLITIARQKGFWS